MKMQVIVEGTAYEVEIVDLYARPVVAIVDGERFEVWTETASTPIVRSLDGRQVQLPAVSPAPSISPPTASAPSAASSVENGTVCAPIPGVILVVRVKVGDRVTAGQEVCVLEAMKMQNSIRTKQAGVVTAVHVGEGQHVKHHQPLLVIAPE